MSIIEKLKKSIESVIGEGRFYYNEAGGLNVDLDNANYPCAFAQLVETGTIEDTLGSFHEQVSVLVYFADIADPDMEPMPNEDILTERKKQALVWLATLRNNDDLNIVSIGNTDRVYIKVDRFDVRLTAFAVNVTLQEVKGYGVCDIEECDCGGC